MSSRYEILTLFDCTETGVQNHKKSSVIDEAEWHFKRNQQRNYETLIQCISLRCQPLNIKGPYIFGNNEEQLHWQISFETDRENIFATESDPLGVLKDDFSGVPMIVGLTENCKDFKDL